MKIPTAILGTANVLLLIICSSATDGQIYEFQESGELDTETCLIARLPSRLPASPSPSGNRVQDRENETFSSDVPLSEVLHEYSICMSVLIFSYLPVIVFFNYFTELKKDTIDFGLMNRNIYICEYTYRCQRIEYPIYPETWYQLCVVATHTYTQFYLNGVLVSTFPRKRQEVPLGGLVAVGQDQDSPGANFSTSQTFRGRVAYIGMWPRALSLKEVNDAVYCDEIPGNILPWGTPLWQEFGRVHRVNGSHCPHLFKQLVPFWERLSIDAAKEKVKSLGMVLATPQSCNDLQSYIHLLKSASTICSKQYGNRKYVLVNAVYNGTTGKLININNNTIINISVHEISSDGTSRNVILDDVGLLKLTKRSKLCFMGEYFTWRPTFYLHGLCEVDDEEGDYTQFFVATNSQHPLYFVGVNGEMIVRVDASWYVIHRYRGVTMASLESISLPLGRREWNVTSKDPFCTFTLGYKTLVFSMCNRDEFTCNDGSCVPLTRRCDLEPDCTDWSDEHYCQTVSLPEGYLAHLPPPPPINFTLNVWFSHVQLDLKSMTFTMKITFVVKWYDGRLDYLNLRKGRYENELSMNAEGGWSVWVPKLQLNDILDHGTFSSPSVYVLQETNGTHLPDDIKYPGTNNALTLYDQIMPKFKCPLDLRLYPWDSQTCNISIAVINVRRKNIHIVDSGGQYLGEDDLQEYEFGGWWLNSSKDTVRLSFQLIRRYEKHVWTTIVPTSLLLLISYGTLFIPLESFAERGTMSLTTLLVLVSLYTETLSSLPTTSYNKKIEKWYILIIVYVSLIIAVHLATSHTATDPSFKSNQNSSGEYLNKVENPAKIFWKRQGRAKHWLPSLKRLLHGAQVVFGIMIIGIVVLYSKDLF